MSEHAHLVPNYLRLREMGRALNHRLVETLSRSVMDEGGRKLGVLEKDTLILGSEDELAVLMDYCIYNIYRGGRNAAQKMLAEPESPDANTAAEDPGAEPDAEVSFVTRDLGPILPRAKLAAVPTTEDVISGVREALRGAAASPEQPAPVPTDQASERSSKPSRPASRPRSRTTRGLVNQTPNNGAVRYRRPGSGPRPSGAPAGNPARPSARTCQAVAA